MKEKAETERKRRKEKKLTAMLTPEGESTIVHERLLERLFVFVAAVGCRFDGDICCGLGCRGFSAPGEYRRQECHGDNEDSCFHDVLVLYMRSGICVASFAGFLSVFECAELRH